RALGLYRAVRIRAGAGARQDRGGRERRAGALPGPAGARPRARREPARSRRHRARRRRVQSRAAVRRGAAAARALRVRAQLWYSVRPGTFLIGTEETAVKSGTA